MYTSTILLLATASMAFAYGGESEGSNSATCAEGNTVACCDTTGANGILGNVLGGSCDIPNLLSISNNCPSGNTFCCPTNSDGSINVALTCSPISA